MAKQNNIYLYGASEAFIAAINARIEKESRKPPNASSNAFKQASILKKVSPIRRSTKD